MASRRGDTLLHMMLFIEMYTLNRAWTDLTDDEFFWEPAPGSWNVRRRDTCCTPHPFGSGDWVADFDGDVAAASVGGASAEPLTSIAWLFWHFGSMAARTADLDFLGGTERADTGWPSPYIADHPVGSTADDAVDMLQIGWRSLDRALRASTDDALEAQTRFWGYPVGPPARGYQVVALILNEISHHGTQVCMLRDLYRTLHG